MSDINYYCFVYGTLKRGCYASKFLKTSKFLGVATTTKDYTLYGSNFYPGMILEKNNNGIEGEVYLIDNTTKLKLDLYEGVSFGLFKNIAISLQYFDFTEEFSDIIEKIIKKEIEVLAYLYQGSLNNFKKISVWR